MGNKIGECKFRKNHCPINIAQKLNLFLNDFIFIYIILFVSLLLLLNTSLSLCSSPFLTLSHSVPISLFLSHSVFHFLYRCVLLSLSLPVLLSLSLLLCPPFSFSTLPSVSPPLTRFLFLSPPCPAFSFFPTVSPLSPYLSLPPSLSCFRFLSLSHRPCLAFSSSPAGPLLSLSLSTLLSFPVCLALYPTVSPVFLYSTSASWTGCETR